MSRSIFQSPAAFAPFYEDEIAVRGTAQSGTFKACIFENGLDDPLMDASIAADRRAVMVHIPKHGDGGWNCEGVPAVGDRLTLLSWGGKPCSDEFAVSSVSDFGDAWILAAREVAR
ncbi:MAG: hypothetical protein IKO72_12310 [Kiritimatiellae bacterium]|nr:hypothetical protein [Kiritimatiellia bacterium]